MDHGHKEGIKSGESPIIRNSLIAPDHFNDSGNESLLITAKLKKKGRFIMK